MGAGGAREGLAARVRLSPLSAARAPILMPSKTSCTRGAAAPAGLGSRPAGVVKVVASSQPSAFQSAAAEALSQLLSERGSAIAPGRGRWSHPHAPPCMFSIENHSSEFVILSYSMIH